MNEISFSCALLGCAWPAGIIQVVANCDQQWSLCSGWRMRFVAVKFNFHIFQSSHLNSRLDHQRHV